MESLHDRVREATGDEFISLLFFHRGVYPGLISSKFYENAIESFWNRGAVWYQFVYCRADTSPSKAHRITSLIMEVFGMGDEIAPHLRKISEQPEEGKEESENLLSIRNPKRGLDDLDCYETCGKYKKRMMNYQSFLTDSRCVY